MIRSAISPRLAIKILLIFDMNWPENAMVSIIITRTNKDALLGSRFLLIFAAI
jgi:hypothetical protein